MSGLTAGGPCTSFRARPREIRISPRSSRPQEHAAHAFEPPCGLSARSQVDFAHACRAVLFPHATRVLRKLALAFILQPAHHSGRFGCVLADMRMMVRRLFCGALGLWSAGSVGVLPSTCRLCRVRCIRWLCAAHPKLVLVSLVEPAHGLGRFECVVAELRTMVCGICGGLLALLNAGVRGARLLLAVARGAQKCMGRIRAELWSSVDP